MKRLVAILCCLVIMAVSIPFSVSAEGTESVDIDFKGRIFMLKNGPIGTGDDFYYSPVRVLSSKSETTEFHSEIYGGRADQFDPNFAKYIDSLTDNFFNDNALLVVCTETGNPGLDLISLDLDKDGNLLTVDMDFSDMNPEWCYPDSIQPIFVVLEIDRSVLEGVNSITADREYIPYSPYLEAESQVFTLDYFPADYDGELYVIPSHFIINSPDSLDEFLAIEFEEGNNSPSIREYLSNLDSDLFKESSIIIDILEASTPGLDFTKVNLSKKDGVLTVESQYTVELGVCHPDECSYYVSVAVIKNDLLWDVTDVDSVLTDVTVYPKLDYVYTAFNGMIEGDYGSEPMVITDSEALDSIVSASDSAGFKRYAGDLGEDFFDSKALVIIYREFDYTNIRYTDIEIADRANGDGENWTVVITADQYYRKKGEAAKIFVFEIDKSYADKSFYASVKKINIKGDVNENGIVESVDYVMLKRAYFGTFELKDSSVRLGDINGNGEIDSMDYVLLKRAYFGTYDIK